MTDGADTGAAEGGAVDNTASETGTLADTYADDAGASQESDASNSESSSQEEPRGAQSENDEHTSEGEGDESEKGESDAEEGEDGGVVYEAFTMPEGMELNQELMDKVTPILQAHNMPQEDAQKVVDVGSELVSTTIRQMTEKHEARVQGWYDKTVEEHGKGGEAAFGERSSVAARALEKYFSDEEKEVIKQYGVENMPGMFTMFYAVGQHLGEDGIGIPSSQGKSGQERSHAEVWYE
jgi:predicted XRE-type DNA-binding protein